MEQKDTNLDKAISQTFPASDPVAVKPDPPITDNQQASRFERKLEEGTEYIQYKRNNGSIELVCTEVPPPAREKGNGTALVMGVLDRLRAEGKPVVVSCKFASAIIKDRPEYKDFVEVSQG